MPSHPTPIRFNRILLTGAAGGLGRELRARLKAYCTTVRLSVIADLGEALLEWKNLLALVLVCGGIWLVTRDAPAPKESALCHASQIRAANKTPLASLFRLVVLFVLPAAKRPARAAALRFVGRSKLGHMAYTFHAKRFNKNCTASAPTCSPCAVRAACRWR